MHKVPCALLAWFFLGAGGASQSADPAELVGRYLSGQMAGLEESDAGRSEGRCRFSPALGGRWLLWEYASTLQGRPFYAAQQLFLVKPDGEVHAYHAGSDGAWTEWHGRAQQRGMSLKRFDDQGNLLGMQIYQWDQESLEFKVLGRRGPGEVLQQSGSARYRPTTGLAMPEASEAAWEHGRALPYARYLGRFTGAETSEQGETVGTIETEPILDGTWYRSDYRSTRDGEVVYSSLGFIRCRGDGSYVLHWFGQDGGHGRIDGKLSEDGALASSRNAAGVEVERHTDRRTPQGYRYTLETRRGADDPWKSVFRSEYRRDDSD